MPERVVRIAQEVSSLATGKLREIDSVADTTKMLALNALIQAASAGEHGRSFSVVAEEVGRVAGNIRALSQGLHSELAPKIGELDGLGRRLVEQVRGRRLGDLALNCVELIDRNLYERSCDVRWWATDSAVVDVCSDPSGEGRAAFASRRLGVILDSYTVYLDLWVADREGRVIAHGRPDRYANVIGTRVSDESWFQQAIATRDGTDFAVTDIAVAPKLGGEPVATYATAIRAGGDTTGEVIGALGIFFDWGVQSQAIVEGVRLDDDERDRTRVLLLDANGRVIAASDRSGVLSERIKLRLDDEQGGFYTDDSGGVVGYALTPGYETYEGLGWYGVIVQHPPARELDEPREAIRRQAHTAPRALV